MKIAEASVDLIVLKCVICDVNAYTVTVFCVAQHESGARNDSVTVYSKRLSSQCNLRIAG
jgi:hypothetical protein